MRPKIYDATDRAAVRCPGEKLDGSLDDAQHYVDQITKSRMWKKSFAFDPPTKVILEYNSEESMGGALLYHKRRGVNLHAGVHRGLPAPLIQVGHLPSFGKIPAIADPWLLVHELSHVLEFNVGHGREFVIANAKLVGQVLGMKHLTALVDAMQFYQMRLNYRSIEWPT